MENQIIKVKLNEKMDHAIKNRAKKYSAKAKKLHDNFYDIKAKYADDLMYVEDMVTIEKDFERLYDDFKNVQTDNVREVVASIGVMQQARKAAGTMRRILEEMNEVYEDLKSKVSYLKKLQQQFNDMKKRTLGLKDTHKAL